MPNRRMVRVELTQVEAMALLASNSHTEAGEMGEIFSNGTEINSFERADQKIRLALSSAQQDTAPNPSVVDHG
jgi:hypothetical protein